MQKDNRRYKEAMYYARLGWRVFPCHSTGIDGLCTCSWGASCVSPAKHPRIEGWREKASVDQNTIRAWFMKWPDSNIGIATGIESGIVVVDIDPKNGGDETVFDFVAASKRLPHTPEVQTGGGGRHLYYAHPGIHLKNNNNGKVGAGFDIKADGGYVIAPNSLHISGNSYVWEESSKPHNVDLALLPSWLLEIILQDDEKPIDVTDVGFIAEGQRNNILTSLAGVLRHKGFHYDEILAAIMVVNKQRCIPPLDDKEVENICTSIERYAPDEQIGSMADRFKVTWAKEAMEPQPPINWIVKDLIPEAGLCLIVGEPGSKKTFTMMDLSVCVAMGSAWLGMETVKTPVLYIDEESGTYRMKRRLGAIMRGHLVDDQFPQVGFITMANFDPRRPEDLTHLQILVHQTDAKLVVVDALADIMAGSDENLVKDVQPVMNNLRQVTTSTGAAIALIHHTNKMGTYRGSSALKGAVDLLLMVRSERKERLIFFEVEKSRDAEPFEFNAEIIFDRDEIWLKGITGFAKERGKEYQRQILNSLLALEQATKRELMEALNVDDKRESTISSTLSAMKKMGLIEMKADGRSPKYILTARGFEMTGV